jgi:LysM repeat protein
VVIGRLADIEANTEMNRSVTFNDRTATEVAGIYATATQLSLIGTVLSGGEGIAALTAQSALETAAAGAYATGTARATNMLPILSTIDAQMLTPTRLPPLFAASSTPERITRSEMASAIAVTADARRTITAMAATPTARSTDTLTPTDTPTAIKTDLPTETSRVVTYTPVAVIYSRAECTYTVQRGDTLDSIAARFNVTRQVIISRNLDTFPDGTIPPDDRISSGQRLFIPSVGCPGYVPPRATSTPRPPTAVVTITCEVTPLEDSTGVNLRRGPGTSFVVGAALQADERIGVVSYAFDSAGIRWWRTVSGLYVREDTVSEIGNCWELSRE